MSGRWAWESEEGYKKRLAEESLAAQKEQNRLIQKQIEAAKKAEDDYDYEKYHKPSPSRNDGGNDLKDIFEFVFKLLKMPYIVIGNFLHAVYSPTRNVLTALLLTGLAFGIPIVTFFLSAWIFSISKNVSNYMLISVLGSTFIYLNWIFFRYKKTEQYKREHMWVSVVVFPLLVWGLVGGIGAPLYDYVHGKLASARGDSHVAQSIMPAPPLEIKDITSALTTNKEFSGKIVAENNDNDFMRVGVTFSKFDGKKFRAEMRVATNNPGIKSGVLISEGELVDNKSITFKEVGSEVNGVETKQTSDSTYNLSLSDDKTQLVGTGFSAKGTEAPLRFKMVLDLR